MFLNERSNRTYSLTWPASMQIYRNKLNFFYIREESNSQRICLEHQYGRHVIVLEHQYGCCDVNMLYCLLFSQNLQRVGSCLFNIHFFTSNTIIKMIHIHSFDPEGAKIYQSLYLLYFHLLNSHWPVAFASLMFILTSLRTISSLFFF